MAKENVSIWKKIKNKAQDMVGAQEGVSGHEEQALMRDPKPYASFTSDGVFTGYDGSTWVYFKMPHDVQTYWTKTKDDGLFNQMFLSNVFNRIGRNITDYGTSTKNDTRVRFHISTIREQTDEIQLPSVTTPSHKDFVERMGGFAHSEWHSYLGLELQEGSIWDDVYGIREQAKHYVDFIMSRSDVHYELYKESLNLYNTVCIENGLQPLDYYAHKEDFDRLTSWYGQEDSYYGVRRELATTPLFIPDTQRSVFANDTEMAFFAISPQESQDLFMVNPKDDFEVDFGRELFAPRNRVVHINIRGQIRSPYAAKYVFDNKLTGVEYTQAGDSMDEQLGNASEKAQLDTDSYRAAVASMEADRMHAAWLDNTEITVATLVDGTPQTLNENLHNYGLKATNVIFRQHVALCSTVPCFPRPIFPVSKRNNVKNPHVNSFYSGVLSASGLFRSTRLSSNTGVLLGLSSEGHEYVPIYTDLDDSKKYKAPPIILMTGDSGSGKALPLDTRIPTPSGWTTMGSVKVGDSIWGPDGNPTKVTYKTPIQYNHRLFTMNMDDGQEITSDSNHQWIVNSKSLWNKRDEVKHAVELLADNLPGVISEGELSKFIHVPELHWVDDESIQASLDFVGVVPEDGQYNGAEVSYALNQRVQQKLFSSVSWRDDAMFPVRYSSAELYYAYINNEDFVASLPTTNPINRKSQREIPVDSKLLGFLTSAAVDVSSHLVRPSNGHYVYERDEESRDEILELLQSVVPQVVCDDYGAFVVQKDGIEKIRSIVNNPSYYTFIETEHEKRRFLEGAALGYCYGDYTMYGTRVTLGGVPGGVMDIIVDMITSLGAKAYNLKPLFYVGGLSVEFDPEELVGNKTEISIVSIREADTQPVQCIQVDNKYHSYLIEDYVPTSNTVQMLMMLAQAVYLGRSGIMINPKPRASAKGLFDLLGGVTIKMSTEYLNKFPGQLDPMFYMKDREQVGNILADMIISAMRYNSNSTNAVKNTLTMETLRAEFLERAKMRANECSWDVIAGNKRVDPPTPPLSNSDVIDFVQSKLKTSSFWKASISKDPTGRSSFKNTIESGKPILIEWEGSINLPDKETPVDEYTPSQMDGVQSILNVFTYSSEILSGVRQGGILAIDEAHHLKRSTTIVNKLTTSGREWRSSGVTLLLATQEVMDFLNPEDVDISSYVRLFIFMHIAASSKPNIERFLELVDIEDTDKLREFITHAKPDEHSPFPGAFIKDRTTKWEGGIVCGPFPKRELDAIKAGESGESVAPYRDRKDMIRQYQVTEDDLANQIKREDESSRYI